MVRFWPGFLLLFSTSYASGPSLLGPTPVTIENFQLQSQNPNHRFLQRAAKAYTSYFFKLTPGYSLQQGNNGGLNLRGRILADRKIARLQIQITGNNEINLEAEVPFRRLDTLQQRLFLIIQTRLAYALVNHRVDMHSFKVDILNRYLSFQQTPAYIHFKKQLMGLKREAHTRQVIASLARLNFNLGDISRFLGATETSHWLYKNAESLHIKSQLEDHIFQTYLVTALARDYYYDGKHKESYRLLSRALENIDSLEKAGEADIFLYARVGELAYEVKKFDMAEGLVLRGSKSLGNANLEEVFFHFTRLATRLCQKNARPVQAKIWGQLLRATATSGLSNSTVYLATRLNLVTSYLDLRQFKKATKQLKKMLETCNLLKATHTYHCTRAIHYTAYANHHLGRQAYAKKLFRQAHRGYRHLKDWQLASEAQKQQLTLRYENIQGMNLKAGFSNLEEKTISSYLGGYTYSKHTPAVRARTYDQRQDDTNILLNDLLSSSKSQNSYFSFLQEKIIDRSLLNQKGKGVLFIDIGPAVANWHNPAVTSLNTALKFPGMQVVALDLPNEVARFNKYVPAKAKLKLQNQKRLHILSADGMKSLTRQMNQRNNWHFKKKKFPDWQKQKLVVVRAANSIDIYFDWNKLKPVLKQMASDFEEKPLLVFLNRVILYKKKNSKQLKYIGRLSIRGFHHNKHSFDRQGEKPYALLPLF